MLFRQLTFPFSQEQLTFNFPEEQLDFSFPKENVKTLRKAKTNREVASLFSGIGGIDLAFQNAGFKILWCNEIDRRACEVYSINFDSEVICDAIKNLKNYELKPVDIVTAGFPCKPFSVAGYRRGFDDERISDFFDLMDVVKRLTPRVLFLENVKNVRFHDNGKSFRRILNCIERMNYYIHYKIMNTCEYSKIPQNRERLYIVCFKLKDDFEKFKFPKKVEERFSVQDLIDSQVEDYFYCRRAKYYNELKKVMKNINTCYQWRRSYVRENKSNLCPTLTECMGTGGDNVPIVMDSVDIRKLTPRECARFQGFNENFIFPSHLAISTLYKQLGNNASIPVVEAIAQNILIALR